MMRSGTLAISLAALSGLSIAGLAIAGLVLADDPPSEAEERAAHQRFRSESDARLEAFLRTMPPAEARTLPRVELDADYVRPADTLEEVAKLSEAILVGSVARTEFEYRGDSITHNVVQVRVEEVLKGGIAVDAEITVRQIGGPEPGPFTDGHHHPYLVESSADPLLFEGDRSLLHLARTADGGWYVLPAVGQVRIVGGLSVALDENPIKAEIGGLTVSTLVERWREVAEN